MNIPGPRPQVEGVYRGVWEAEVVYLAGDTVEYDDLRYEATVDHRAGFLPPPVCIDDGYDRWRLL